MKRQIFKSLHKTKKINNIIFAYEPVWSIGTGKIPKIKELSENIIFIKKYIMKKYKIKYPKVLYGGSVTSETISKLKKINIIDGFLVGGSSQNSKKFIDIIKKTFI